MRDNTDIVMVQDANRTELRCPVAGCDQSEMTHVVGVVWEKDPEEGDRKRVRMEVRCEHGHGFILLIKNHAGSSYFQWEVLTDIRSPFGEDAPTW
jgi:hypothetical protein